MKIKENEMKKEDGISYDADEQKECDCLFCNSKCPGCGSDDVGVLFRPTFIYDNDTNDSIDIAYVDVEAELTCNECGMMFFGDDLEELINSVEKSLNITNFVIKAKGNGAITTYAYL